MARQSWLPIGLVLPDGARCGRPLHDGPSWQIIQTRGGGRALLARRDLVARWTDSGLLEQGALREFAYGPEVCYEASCGPSQRLAPIAECESPRDKDEALAFAIALKASREIDGKSHFQDAIYFERFTRLLPTYGITSTTDDDVVLGYWLTGGARVSARAFRRLQQMMTWLDGPSLLTVLEAAGLRGPALRQEENGGFVGASEESGDSESPSSRGGLDQGQREEVSSSSFSLPGRPALEAFLNEHIVEVIQHRERYRALGVGFPPPIVLHGPPGCGKTYAVEQLVAFLGWPSFQIDASSVASPYIHETSRRVAEVFSSARRSAPSVLVIDEMEAFLASREGGSTGNHFHVEEVGEFLRRIPEAAENDVLLFAMTNRLDLIDPAILRRGRFDHVVKVGFPTQDEIIALLGRLLSKLPRDGTIDVPPLALSLAGRPLSDVAFVVREGARLAARAGNDRLSQRFLVEALDSASSRVKEESAPRVGFV